MEFTEVIFDRKDSDKPDESPRLPYQYIKNPRLIGQEKVKDSRAGAQSTFWVQEELASFDA